jgi:hypothetical protein
MSWFKIMALVASVALAHSALTEDEDEQQLIQDPVITQNNLIDNFAEINKNNNADSMAMPIEDEEFVVKDLNYYMENYQMECLCCVGLIVAFVVCFTGSSKNSSLAQ